MSEKKYAVNLEVAVDHRYTTGQVAAGIGLAFSDCDSTEGLTLVQINVEQIDD